MGNPRIVDLLSTYRVLVVDADATWRMLFTSDLTPEFSIDAFAVPPPLESLRRYDAAVMGLLDMVGSEWDAWVRALVGRGIKVVVVSWVHDRRIDDTVRVLHKEGYTKANLQQVLYELLQIRVPDAQHTIRLHREPSVRNRRSRKT